VIFRPRLEARAPCPNLRYQGHPLRILGSLDSPSKLTLVMMLDLWPLPTMKVHRSANNHFNERSTLLSPNMIPGHAYSIDGKHRTHPIKMAIAKVDDANIQGCQPPHAARSHPCACRLFSATRPCKHVRKGPGYYTQTTSTFPCRPPLCMAWL
jgi:hypothetical protein